MAKILDKDPFTYQKERDSFLRDLSRFHAGRGTSYSGFPCLGGKEVDLYLLYSKVTQLGGWVKVTNEQKWEEIQELFHIPPACANAAQALKIIYVRYLSHYEKVHHFGEDPDRIRDDQLDDNSVQARKKTTGPVGGVPMSYNYGQHNIPDHVRESMGLKVPKHLVASGEYKNLIHSLMSGLPNEVDFALNICTLLSNEGQHTIELQKCPHLLKLLLAHMGIYGHDHESLYMLHEQGWKNYTKRNFPRFWYDSVRDEKIRKFLAPDSLQVSKFTTSFSPPPLPSPESVGDEAMDCMTDMTEEQHSEDNEPDLANVFALDRDMGMYDTEGQRVLQLAMIIRNLSFEKGNMKVLSKDVATFRFLMLCIHSKYNALRQLALDTLSNIALEMVLSPISVPMTKLVFQLIAHCIASPDKFDVISGLDMLARLCQVEANEEVICDNLEDATYENIVHLLTIHDIQLIVYSLETLYQLSELGEVTNTHIAAIRMAVETLVNLVTVEAQAYGPESLVGIKVVEHVTTIPLPGEKAVPTTSQASIQQQMAVQQPANLAQPESKSAQTAQVGVGLTNSNLNKGKKPMSLPAKRPPCPVTPARPGPVITPPPVTPSPAALTKAAVQPLKAQPELDSDTLACNWLQAHYEFVGTDGKVVEEIPKMELYGEFLTTCGRLFIKNIANASCFANCVRMTFSKVESVKVKRADGTTEQIYRGLKKRDPPLPFPPNTEFGQLMPPVHGLQRSPTPNAALPGSPQAQLQHSNIGQPRHHLMSAHGNQLNSPPLSPTRYPQGATSAGSPISPTHYPTIQQALLGGRGQDAALKSPLSQSVQQPATQGTNSTLIKSLLANKVSQNICRQQVEQVLSQNSMPIGQQTSQQARQGLPQQSQESGSHGTGTSAQQTQQTSIAVLNPAKTKTGTSSPPSTPTLKSKLQTRFRSSKSRNNGNDVVITDSKTIENLIESVARQGSVEGEENEKDGLVPKFAAGLGVSSNDVCIMQVQGGLEHDSRDKHTEKMPEADGDNNLKTKVGPSGDACIPSINGTSTQGSSELNGDRASVHVNLAEVTSCRVIIDKAKPQHILNGAIHHFGNGNSTKLNKTKSKDLETVNSKICETQTVMNSQSDTSCTKRDSTFKDDCSVRSVVGCDDEDERTDSKEVSKEVLENGFAMSVTEKSCEVPQLDGTVDEDEAPKSGTSIGASQQNNNMPQMVSSGAQLPALTAGTSVTATGSQALPVKVVYTQGLVTQGQLAQSVMDSTTTVKIQPSSVQSQVQRLTSAGRTVTYVPQAAQPQLQGQPQVVHGQPQVIQGQTQVVPGQPQVIHGQPQMIQGQPQVAQGQSQVVQSQLQVVHGQPQVVQSQTQVVQGQRQVIQGQPQVGQGHPQVVQGQPQVVQGQPQVVQGQPQVVQGQPQIVQGQPQVVQGQTQVVQGQTQVVQGQVQVVQSGTSHTQPQLAAAQPGQQQQIVHNPLQLQQQQLQLQQQQLQMQLQQLQQMQQQIQQQWIQTQQQLSQTVGQQGSITTSQPQPSTTPSTQSYIMAKGPPPATPSTEQSTTTSQSAQLSPNQQQTYILPKPQSQQQQQQQQQQQVQMVLRPQQLTQQIQAVNQQASLAISAAKSSQAQSSIVGLPVSVQAVSTQQPHSSQSGAVQAPSQISVQATRFVLPQGQMAVRPQMSVRPITSQYTQVQHQPQAATTVQSQPQLVQSQATIQQQTTTSQTQVLQSQVRPQLVQGQPVSQPSQAQVIQQAVRTHLVQQPHMLPTHGQPQVLAPTQVMQQHFLQQRQLMQQVSQQGQVIQPIQGQNVVVSGQSQGQLASQAVLQRPQYIQSQVVSGHLPTVTTQSQQLLQGQPQVLQTQAQFLQKGHLVQPGSTPQLIQQTTATGAKVTVMVPSQQQLLQYQQSITSQQQLIQKQLATSIAQQQQQQQQQQQPATSVSQPVVSAPTIQIPVSQLTLPLCQTTTPQSASITSSPVSTPPPPSPQSSKASLPSPNTVALNKKKRPAPIPPQMEKCFKKKKPMMNVIETRPPTRNQTAVVQPSPVICNKYHCEWAGCKQWFDTIKLFNRHVIREHFEKQHQQAVCKWEGCDGLRRPKWSLMTHLQDRHLNDTSLKNPAKKPEPSPPTSNVPKPPPPAAPSGGVPGGPVPVYPDNAAIQAIRRFAAKPPFPEFVEMKEGPVTKHIRLTSALVLRNLARYSALGRSMLKKHEERLSFVALSAVEASSPIANCLWELHQTDPH